MLQAWKQALELLGQRLDDPEFDGAARGLLPLRFQGKTILVEAADQRAVDTLQQRFLRDVEEAVSLASGTSLRVVFQAPSSAQQELFPVPTKAAEVDLSRRRRQSGLQPQYTFDNFVVGSGSQFAHAACRAVANLPGETYNPLFVYGSVGVGKTHLVNAIGNAVIDREPIARVQYVTSEAFMNDLITAIQREGMADLKARFRRVDVLIIEDVQFLAGRERTQEEFFHTFNALYESRRQIILTSDRFPKDIPQLEERLRNRFEWGLIADIQAPDVETRVAIVLRKAEDEGLRVPHDVALFLASRYESNVRELEGALTRIAAHSSLQGLEINMEMASAVLRDRERAQRPPITIDAVQKAVCSYYSIGTTEIRSKKRTRTIALPRQVAMFLCRRYTDASYPAIGDHFGGRDHSTVIHATQVVGERLKEDAALRAAIESIGRVLESGG